MAQIQIIDLNPSDFGSMEELTDEELLDINGGSFWYDFNFDFDIPFPEDRYHSFSGDLSI